MSTWMKEIIQMTLTDATGLGEVLSFGPLVNVLVIFRRVFW